MHPQHGLEPRRGRSVTAVSCASGGGFLATEADESSGRTGTMTPMRKLAGERKQKQRSAPLASASDDRFVGRLPLLGQAKDRWGNHLRDSSFAVTAELFVGTPPDTDGEAATDGNGAGPANASSATPSAAVFSVSFLGNGSGIALVTYVPLQAGVHYLHGELRRRSTEYGWQAVSRVWSRAVKGSWVGGRGGGGSQASA